MSSLIEFLSKLSAANNGTIPFPLFMENALYHPEHGYYTANIETVGRQGDFSTSATLLPELALALAAWIQEEQSHHREHAPGISHLIEIGPGDGTLLYNALRHLRHRVRRALTVHLVEISPKLEALQRERLAKFGNIHWHRDTRSALAAAGHQALLYSNELVDAFPATALRLNRETNQWEEIHLSFNEAAGLTEIFRPFPMTRDEGPGTRDFYSALALDFPPNQRIEIHPSYLRNLQSWLPSLQQGSLLTIDYGDTSESLYHRRPLGSLRAYYKQQRFDGPPEIYARFGKQDLTADVNFTDLVDWGEALGLETISLQTQAEFTGSPEPAAGAFRVLHQRKP